MAPAFSLLSLQNRRKNALSIETSTLFCKLEVNWSLTIPCLFCHTGNTSHNDTSKG